MSIAYFIYLILFIATMVGIFTVSFLMLNSRTRVMFKAPVPYLHKTLGVLLIPWGATFVMYLPDKYLALNDVMWRDHEYIVVSLLSTLVIVSISVWTYTECLQQGVNQKRLQPAIVTLPLIFTLWYAVKPASWLLHGYLMSIMFELTLVVFYYARLYQNFVLDMKTNYSHISANIIRIFWTQWVAALAAFVVFLMSAMFDSVWWNIINIFTNIAAIAVLIYTTENIVPLEVHVDMDKDMELDMQEEIEECDMKKVLYDNCEAKLLFCNPELSLQDLSLAIGTNRTYLSRWFVRHNTTFYTYINGLRIEYAAKLLLTTNYSVSEVQTAAGFASKTTFLKYFTERYGCPPTAYRKNNK